MDINSIIAFGKIFTETVVNEIAGAFISYSIGAVLNIVESTIVKIDQPNPIALWG